jgi:putative transposase
MTTPTRYADHWFPPEVISHAIWLSFRFPLTIRTQSTILSWHWTITIWTRVTQRNDMADLQAVLMHNEVPEGEAALLTVAGRR